MGEVTRHRIQRGERLRAVLGQRAHRPLSLTSQVVVLVVFLMTSTLTEIVSNNAVAVIMTPLAIGLASALGLDPRIAGIAADWVDADQEAEFPDGAEDPIYTGFIPPYRTANQTLTTVSELAALEGIDKASLDILLPHVVALPGRTAINVNTASGVLIYLSSMAVLQTPSLRTCSMSHSSSGSPRIPRSPFMHSELPLCWKISISGSVA